MHWNFFIENITNDVVKSEISSKNILWVLLPRKNTIALPVKMTPSILGNISHLSIHNRQSGCKMYFGLPHDRKLTVIITYPVLLLTQTSSSIASCLKIPAIHVSGTQKTVSLQSFSEGCMIYSKSPVAFWLQPICLRTCLWTGYV